ncbi:MAG: biotin/lipoate A/B protein ligase family protein [Halobellus sp.]|uniref:biotin/lipoate A/B protein ligase family protein n=1 Tax=Halobellus sp. TaxID=1979212 RepID=UPI0035D4644E
MGDDSGGPLADREWRLIREEARDGPMQMALDEVAAETAADGGPRTVRVYRWDPSTLSLGYRQDPDTVDWDHCEEAGVSVTRRQTGGGGIYHDVDGDVSYSIAAPKRELPGDLLDAYHLLCEPVLDAFGAVGIDADYVSEPVAEIWSPACYLRELHPAHDIVAEGRKISGNAQYRQQDAVVQHGSLTYAVKAIEHLATFTGHDVDHDRFRDRVVGVDELTDISRAEFVEAVEDALATWADAAEGSWTDDELARARERAAEKYRSEAWIQRRTD